MSVFTEAERASLEVVLKEGVIDDAWIKGIKKGWKKLVAQTKNYKGRVEKAPDMEQVHIQYAAHVATKALANMQRYIQVLRDDLLMDKGFWTLPAPEGEKPTIAQKMKGKVIDELDVAETAISDAIRHVEWNRAETNRTGPLGHPGTNYADAHKSQERYDWYLRSFGAQVDEAVDTADGAIGRLFRHLNTLLGKSFKHVQVHPTTGSPEWQKKLVWQKQQVPLDFGEIPPEVVHVGKTTIFFHDIPKTGTGVGVVSPARVGTKSSAGDIALQPLGKRQGYEDPRNREKLIDVIRDARAALRSKGLEKLFVREFHVRPQSQACENPYGAHFGVGGAYHQDTDSITIFGQQSVGLVVHEIGHRYWDKHMSAEDRHNFSRWFGDVPAVSVYGATQPWEDFAEVFMYYVLNKKLTKDQRERFMQFMKGKRPRLEMIEGSPTAPQKCAYCDQPAVKSLMQDDGDFVPVCQAHVGEGRRRMRLNNASVVDIKQVSPGPVAYREHTGPLAARHKAAQEPAPSLGGPEPPGTYFGLQGASGRAESALQEAPPNLTPRAPIGRRDVPRGAVIQTRTGDDIMGMTGEPIKRATGKGLGKGTSGPERVYQMPDRTRQEIPDSLLQMLGSDWTTMRAHRDHDNRMTVTVDGVRYTVYTRRG